MSQIYLKLFFWPSSKMVVWASVYCRGYLACLYVCTYSIPAKTCAYIATVLRLTVRCLKVISQAQRRALPFNTVYIEFTSVLSRCSPDQIAWHRISIDSAATKCFHKLPRRNGPSWEPLNIGQFATNGTSSTLTALNAQTILPLGITTIYAPPLPSKPHVAYNGSFPFNSGFLLEVLGISGEPYWDFLDCVQFLTLIRFPRQILLFTLDATQACAGWWRQGTIFHAECPKTTSLHIITSKDNFFVFILRTHLKYSFSGYYRDC